MSVTFSEALTAAFLGFLEGFTEFLPVSSTGHLLLAGHFLGFENSGKAFEVLVQLGAILAVLSVFSAKLLQLLKTAPHDPRSRNFLIGVVLAFLPAAGIGMLLHDFIKSVLFETPVLICISLIVGGLILLWVDKKPMTPIYHTPEQYPLLKCVIIGFAQCLAMIPGVSRSGSTIVAAMLLGSDKKAAAEFSFFLAMPTMAGAFTLDLLKNYKHLTSEDISVISIGFVCALIAGVIAVRGLLSYVSKHGFSLFAYWRLVVGTAGLIGLYFTS